MFVFVSEHGDRACSQHEELAVVGWQAQPAGSENAQNVAVREERHVAFDLDSAIDDIVSARGNLADGFPALRAVAKKNQPAWAFGANLKFTRCGLRSGRNPIRKG